MRAAGAAPFRVLVLCTANRCRSPMAEFLLRDRAGKAGLDWSVSSAGTSAVAGLPPDPEAVALLEASGHDLTGWTTRPLEPGLLTAADLVLTATTAHRSAANRLHPEGIPRTFTLLQFAAMARALDRGPLLGPDGLLDGNALTAAVWASRGLLGSTDPVDLADPVGRGHRAFRRCAEEIEGAAAGLVDGLALPEPPGRWSARWRRRRRQAE